VRRADDFRPTAHPGSRVGDYAETEAHRHNIINGNGADQEPEPYDEEGWVTF
jgi:hypothetical protein